MNVQFINNLSSSSSPSGPAHTHSHGDGGAVHSHDHGATAAEHGHTHEHLDHPGE